MALHGLRRGLEHVATQVAAAVGARMALKRNRLIPELRELIAALDRRVPQVERAGEVSIARDAAALRDKALERIAQLEAAEQIKVAS